MSRIQVGDFQYFNEEFFAEEIALSKIAAQVDTPFTVIHQLH